MKRITTREQLVQLATELGVRPDWHEPDEQDVSATVAGSTFDNAGFWPDIESYPPTIRELHVTLTQDGKPVAAVNLATLFAWASGSR